MLGAVYLGRGADEPAYGDDETAVVEQLAEVAGRLIVSIRHRNASDLLIDRLGRGEARRSDDVRTASSFAIRRLLASARRVLGAEVAYLTQMSPDSVVVLYLDAGPDAPPMREGDRTSREETYCGLLVDGRIPSSVPDLRENPLTAGFKKNDELGVSSYCGAVVRTPDGATFGALCGLSRSRLDDVSPTQIESLRVLAELIDIELGHEQQRRAERERELASFACSTQRSRRSIHLQPIVDLATGRTVGFEALTRFVDPHGNPRRPDLVFEEAAALGVGVKLEQDVAAEALQLLQTVPEDCYLSVNLSPQALIAPRRFRC